MKKGIFDTYCLDEYEMGKMIEFRLRQAGFTEERSLFTREAIHKIYEYTQGYPRQTALICHNAMEILIAENYEVVTGDLIDKVIEREKVWK